MMKNIRKLFTLVSAIILALILFSCGENKQESGTLTLTAAAPTSAGLPAEAVATFEDADGRDPQGLNISFSTDHPEIIRFVSTSASCDSAGAARVQFTNISIPTTTVVTIYAKTGDLSTFTTLTITGNPDAPPPVTPVAPVPTSIAFSSATPTSITLKGMGGAGTSETSDVSFIVKDSNNAGISGVVVDFSLDTSIGGITMAPAFATSDATGRVTTKISSGVISTPVKVTAVVRSAPSLSTTSDQLVILSGFPDQDSLTIALSTLSPEAWGYTDVEVVVTAQMADHFNNPSANKVVYFTTEGGSIEGNCTTSAAGACAVKWRSLNPRPADGRVTILAYTIGEESFTDLNGNGLADVGEFTDDLEAFRDDNENSVRDASEPFIDFNVDGAYNVGDTIFNGALRPASVTGSKTKHIFRNNILVMSGSDAFVTSSVASINGPTNISIVVQDLHGNTMPAGTKIDITTDNGTLTGTTSVTGIPDNIGSGYVVNFGIKSDGTVSAGGFVSIKVTSPKGLITTTLIPIIGGV